MSIPAEFNMHFTLTGIYLSNTGTDPVYKHTSEKTALLNFSLKEKELYEYSDEPE